MDRMRLLEETTLFVVDLDGTVFLGDTLIPGAETFLPAVKEAGKRYVFFSNNSSKSPERYVKKLAGMGIRVRREDIITSGDVMIAYLHAHFFGKRVYLAGTPDLEEAFRAQGIPLTNRPLHDASYGLSADGGVTVEEQPDVVVVGFDLTFNYEKLERACTYIRNGAVFLATHPDINCPTVQGFIPDCGAICAAITRATGVEPKCVGKPFEETVDMVLRITGAKREEVTFVGDRLYTDVKTGTANGARGALVLTGETKEADLAASDVVPDAVFAGLKEMAKLLRG